MTEWRGKNNKEKIILKLFNYKTPNHILNYFPTLHTGCVAHGLFPAVPQISQILFAHSKFFSFSFEHGSSSTQQTPPSTPHGLHTPPEQSKSPSQLLLPQQNSPSFPQDMQDPSRQTNPSLQDKLSLQQNLFNSPHTHSSAQYVFLSLVGFTQHTCPYLHFGSLAQQISPSTPHSSAIKTSSSQSATSLTCLDKHPVKTNIEINKKNIYFIQLTFNI